MSDNWIVLIPEDPRYIPARDRQQRATIRFRELAPDSDEIKVTVSEVLRFFDCGGNFERILCPACRSEIPIDWWGERMQEEDSTGFPLGEHSMVCCGAKKTLHELVYEWPQGFGCFSIEAMNPNIAKLEKRYKIEFEKILGCPLRVIYQHI